MRMPVSRILEFLRRAWHTQAPGQPAKTEFKTNLWCDVKHYQFGNISPSTTWALENGVSMHINKEEKFADRPD